MTPDGQTQVLPGFFEEDGTFINILPPESGDAGQYDFLICSQIDNSLNTKSCTDFTVIVEPLSDANITVSVEPEWIANLEDQRVKVGQSLLYTPGIQYNSYGFLMEVSAELGDAFEFSEYDEQKNMFRVHAGKTVSENVGVYPITITARFFSESYDEKFSSTFFLTVW